MQNVFLVRHGQSDANVLRIFDNSNNGYPLTELGTSQAQQTAEYFSTLPIHAMFCSPIRRAAQTAEIISKRINLPVEKMDEFKEFLIGNLDGQPRSGESNRIFEEVLVQWAQGNPLAAFPNGENHHGLISRFKQGLRKIHLANPEGDLLVVAHGGLIIVGVQATCPEAYRRDWSEIEIPHCSITQMKMQVESKDVKCELVKWADTSHLRQVENSITDDISGSIE